jgi:hypothetical protein
VFMVILAGSAMTASDAREGFGAFGGDLPE